MRRHTISASEFVDYKAPAILASAAHKTQQQALPLDGSPPQPGHAHRGRMKLVHEDIVAARRELLRHGFWPLGGGPKDPETWADARLTRRFCFRREGASVRLVEITN